MQLRIELRLDLFHQFDDPLFLRFHFRRRSPCHRPSLRRNESSRCACSAISDAFDPSSNHAVLLSAATLPLLGAISYSFHARRLIIELVAFDSTRFPPTIAESPPSALADALGHPAFATFSCHSAGKKLHCVHSSTAAISCSSFSKPCADGMNSASACSKSARLTASRPPASAIRRAPSTMLSRSAPDSRRAGSTVGIASSASCSLFFFAITRNILPNIVGLARIEQRNVHLRPALPLQIDRQQIGPAGEQHPDDLAAIARVAHLAGDHREHAGRRAGIARRLAIAQAPRRPRRRSPPPAPATAARRAPAPGCLPFRRRTSSGNFAAPGRECRSSRRSTRPETSCRCRPGPQIR